MSSTKFTPLKFPRDEKVHNHIIEWWYFNGRLKSRDGQEYAFMNCLFRADTRRVQIPVLTKLPIKNLYFYHAQLSDIRRQKFSSIIEPVTMVSADSFSHPLLFINHTTPLVMANYTNRVLEETQLFTYHLKDETVDLELVATKKPLLEGGRGYLNLKTSSTYYYSLTNLKTIGRIKIDGEWREVSGRSWMDHQWADTPYSQNKWNWFSLQFNNQTEIVCFTYENQGQTTCLADIIDARGRQTTCRDVQITPLGATWTSQKTKAVYPLAWRIQIPSQKIDLRTQSLIRQQEMIFGAINYWEGPINVAGRLHGRPAQGVGFMELAGYPSKYSRAFKFTNDLESSLLNFLDRRKKVVRAKLPKLLEKPGRGD
jgi:predicted secreted hydrolase